MELTTVPLTQPTLPSPLPNDHQALMNLFYDYWKQMSAQVTQNNDKVRKAAEDAGVDITHFPFDVDTDTYVFMRDPRQAEIADVMPPKVNAAVVLGNFNYQVNNGGFSQYLDNGYAASVEAVIALFKGAADLGIADAAEVLAIVQEFSDRSESERAPTRGSYRGYCDDDEDDGDFHGDPYGDLCTRYYAIEGHEPLMQAILDRFDEVVAGAFMAGAYKKAA